MSENAKKQQEHVMNENKANYMLNGEDRMGAKEKDCMNDR